MSIPRLRELVKAWQDGTIREAELIELRDALPEVVDILENALTDPESPAPSFAPEPSNAKAWSHEDYQDYYAGRFGY